MWAHIQPHQVSTHIWVSRWTSEDSRAPIHSMHGAQRTHLFWCSCFLCCRHSGVVNESLTRAQVPGGVFFTDLLCNKNQLMSLFQFYLYIAGSLYVSGPQAHPQESSHSCSHNHWFSVCIALAVCSVSELWGSSCTFHFHRFFYGAATQCVSWPPHLRGF